jgi:structural maintenance of chromosome 1
MIRYEPVIERAMLHAYGNALACDTTDVARYVCWERGQGVKGGSTLIWGNSDTIFKFG